jgi:membrane protein DedA with SNARE-associated domain
VTKKQIIPRPKWVRQVAIVVFVVATLTTVLFGLRTYASFLLLRSAYAAGAPMTSSIRPWMTLGYVAATYRTPNAALVERLGLPSRTDPNTSLKSLADQAGLSPSRYTQLVQRTIADIAPGVRSDRTNETSSWLGTIGEEVLTALLVYGYPVLGLTLFLCAIGLPLPDGVATTVAGSLVAQGRMDWVWAGTIAMMAAIVGDAAGYGLGRLLGREVLERHGRWLGYTTARRERVQLLFDRWGSLTVFITRTFMSYLAAVASVLAGMSHYRLSKFLAIALVGRVIWTAAYLGLGYGIGSDWEAATSFLTSLSAFLLSLVVLMGAGVVASGTYIKSAQGSGQPEL